jgi:hypothetical protein
VTLRGYPELPGYPTGCPDPLVSARASPPRSSWNETGVGSAKAGTAEELSVNVLRPAIARRSPDGRVPVAVTGDTQEPLCVLFVSLPAPDDKSVKKAFLGISVGLAVPGSQREWGLLYAGGSSKPFTRRPDKPMQQEESLPVSQEAFSIGRLDTQQRKLTIVSGRVEVVVRMTRFSLSHRAESRRTRDLHPRATSSASASNSAFVSRGSFGQPR